MRNTLLLATLAPLVLLLSAAPAGALTKAVTFEELPPETTVSDQYRDSHGVFFRGPDAGDGAFPIVRSLPPGLAHSGSRVADFSYCFACEFHTPATVGRLTSTARSISVFAGFIGPAGQNPPATLTLIARDAAGALLATDSATVAQGAPFNRQITVTSPTAAADIASFELRGDENSGQTVGFDDLAIEYPDTAVPPDFTLGVSAAPVSVPAGSFVDVPIDINRLNGSNGDVALSVSGLPIGMTATFSPNPVVGTETHATLRLSAPANASPIEAYREATITATPAPGAGPAQRTAKKQVRVVGNCVRTLRTDFIDARSQDCMRAVGPRLLVTDEPVQLNGLQLTPTAGVPRLIIDKVNRTVASELGVWRVSVRGHTRSALKAVVVKSGPRPCCASGG